MASLMSLRGTIVPKQSLSGVRQFNYSRLQLCNEIATPRQVGARNDKKIGARNDKKRRVCNEKRGGDKPRPDKSM